MQVTVVDGNNVTVSLDRGVAGVGIASISLVVINQANYLLITYTNGTTQTVGPVGVIQYNATTPINISGSTISLLTVPVNLGGTGQTTAAAGLNALLPVQTSQANKYLQTDGTNASWDAVSLSTADITGILPVVNGGTGVSTSTGTGNTVLSTSPTLVTPALGTPASGVMTNVTGTAAGLTAGNVTTNANLTGGVTSVGNAATVITNANLTGDITSVGNATTLTNAPVIAKVLTGYISGAGTVAATDSILQAIQKLDGNNSTNANLTGPITSVGNATSIASQTGTGTKFVVDNSPTLISPNLGTPTALVGTNITGTALSFTSSNVTTNANLTGDVTSVGNATAIAAGVIVNADINASAAIDDTKLATIATALKVSNSATTAASANTASAIVARDASGNFTAGTVTAALTGNASTATALATGRTIAITGDLAYTSPSFDGSANVTAAGTLATVATAGVTGSSTAIPVVTINAKGLTTSITTAAVIAPAGTLSGNTLAAGVTGSSLTSLGTIANLSVTAGTISTTPSASTDIANKDYVDTVAQGLDPKASCVAATTVNITLSGTQTIDGVALIAADRCLVKDQTAPAENGIYVVAAGAWARSADMNAWVEVPGAFTFIEQGTQYADTGWVCTSNVGGTLGTTAITFVQFAGAGSYTASTGLTLTGTAFSLTAPVTVALGGTNATSAGITAFNNISGFTAAGATGTTSTNLVFSTSPTLVTPDLGTPSALIGTNITGTAAGLTAGNVTTNANLTGAVTSTGNATLLGSFSSANLAGALTDETGSGSAVFATSPTLVTPALGSPSSVGTMPAFTLGGTVSGGGNQINNVIIGTTTPLAGAFTTLSATGSGLASQTLTINGTTTGANFARFTSTGADGVIGIEGSVPSIMSGSSANATVLYTVGATSLQFGTNSTTRATLSSTALALQSGISLTGGTSGTGYSFSGSAPATSLTLDSSGRLGVGTASPTFGVDVQNTGALTAALSATRFTTAGATSYLYLSASRSATVGVNTALQSGDGMGIVRFSGADGTTYKSSADIRGYVDGAVSTGVVPGRLSFWTNSNGTLNETMRLDSAGNLGLGVTPSAWKSDWKALQNAAGSFASGSTSTLNMAANAFINSGGNWAYVNSDVATDYEQAAGKHIWYNAASGTAGNAISFTQAMTLEAAGTLLVGMTTDTGIGVALFPSGITRKNTNGTVFDQYRYGGASVGTTTTDGANIQYNAASALVFGTNGSTERARIDSSGNLLVGTTSGSARMTVDGGTDLLNFKRAGTTCVQVYVTGVTISVNQRRWHNKRIWC